MPGGHLMVLLSSICVGLASLTFLQEFIDVRRIFEKVHPAPNTCPLLGYGNGAISEIKYQCEPGHYLRAPDLPH